MNNVSACYLFFILELLISVFGQLYSEPFNYNAMMISVTTMSNEHKKINNLLKGDWFFSKPNAYEHVDIFFFWWLMPE